MQFHKICVIAISLIILPGCATVMKGYYSKVELQNAPDSLRVFTADGVELPVIKTALRVQSGTNSQRWIDKPASLIEIRSKYDPVLVLRYQGQEKRVQAYGKIVGGWLFLSTACGLFPAFVDAFTGSWNSFEPIDASFK